MWRIPPETLCIAYTLSCIKAINICQNAFLRFSKEGDVIWLSRLLLALMFEVHFWQGKTGV